MNNIVSVYAVFSTEEEARSIAGMVVDESLAACANILGPCVSIYRWRGTVETAQEVPTIFKTAEDKAEALVARIAELHSYEVPAAMVWPIGHAVPEYHYWVLAETRDA